MESYCCLSCGATIDDQIIVVDSTCWKCLQPYFQNRQACYTILGKVAKCIDAVRCDLYTHDDTLWRFEQLTEAIDDLKACLRYSKYNKKFI